MTTEEQSWESNHGLLTWKSQLSAQRANLGAEREYGRAEAGTTPVYLQSPALFLRVGGVIQHSRVLQDSSGKYQRWKWGAELEMESLPSGLDIQATGLEEKSLAPSFGRRGVEQSWGTFRPENMMIDSVSGSIREKAFQSHVVLHSESWERGP